MPHRSRIIAPLLALAGWLAVPASLHADISQATVATPGISLSFPSGTNTVEATVPPSAGVPGAVTVLNYTGQTQAYALNVTLSAAPFSSTGLGGEPAVFSFENSSGGINVTSAAEVSWTNAQSPASGNTGFAALTVTALPIYESSSIPGYQSGGDISVVSTGNITVAGVSASPSTAAYELTLPAFRTADVSGIQALTFGVQTGSHSTTHPGGNVTVTLQGATIAMSSTDDSIITAGISAATANGPETDGSGSFGSHGPRAVQVTLDDGIITNSSALGAGIIATATGAQFPSSSSTSMAYGGNVSVSLAGNSSMSLTGGTAIGVYAMSQGYALTEVKKPPPVQAGSVQVDVATGASISTGTSSSRFGIGVAAFSAGQDAGIDPFGTQTVNKSGTGNAGPVSVTNNGTIATSGTMSIGIAALGVGGASVLTSNNGDQTSYLGNSGGSTESQGSDITVVNNGGISTAGTSAYGLVALSAGNGGVINNIVASGGNATASGLVVGNDSSGGSASNGGSVSVTHNGTITTGNATSMGIIAQSIGGGGGNAGGNHPAAFVGDKGGKGGNGGSVSVTTSPGSSVSTSAINSLGVLLESIGGGGGTGANAAGIFVAVGGKGGDGGSGGTVNGSLSGSFDTQGDHSAVVVAQSIGGGGGHGGSAHAVGFGADIGIGGKGGIGGVGGSVTVFLSGTSTTTTSLGNNAPALHLQSIGGGGGAGGNALSVVESVALGINLALGGDGGSGSHGGAVYGVNAGTITTGVASTANATNSVPNVIGGDSSAMIAQSIGGGGGYGGSAVGRMAVFGGGEEAPVSIGGTLTLGGSGGSGSNAGDVRLDNVGTLTTYGDSSHGMVSQGIGGGGGIGGDSTASTTLYATTSFKANLVLAIGGNGASGGNGSQVSINNDVDTTVGQVTTFGQSAHGLFAQSIGGGGGASGVGNARAGAPYLPTWGGNSTGGGGGNSTSAASYAFTAGVGGNGGSGGNAGSTAVFNQGSVETHGSGSYGVLAQAIGGGGGTASGGATNGSNNSVTVDISVGGKGGDGGSANVPNNVSGYSVEVDHTGSISTHSGSAIGIAAQSIGGGGGIGGSADARAAVDDLGHVLSVASPSLGYTATLSVGGAGGSGGAGGPVLVATSGNVTTAGPLAYGVIAQSISGGGGMAGSATAAMNSAFLGTAAQFATDIAVGGRGGAAHNGGNVTVGNAGAIATSGHGSHGIIAQSISGGGGVGADGTTDTSAVLGLGIGVNRSAQNPNTARGGSVNVSNTMGNVVTTGGDAIGILAQSIGGGGGIASAGTKSFFSFNGTLSLLPVRADADLGINLSGANDMDGGAVSLVHGSSNATASTTTAGDWSHGLVAQSIGGGGGKASTIFGTNTPAVGNMTFQMGAKDGKGNANAVSLELFGSVSTGTAGANATGFSAYGVLGQSIGGGGGLATDGSAASTGSIRLGGASSSAAGNGGTVTATGAAAVTTRGASSHAVVLQSIGGGGGLGGSGSSQVYTGAAIADPTIRLGGDNTTGSGQAVSMNATLTVSTAGESAFGVVAQSIGGGGGIVTTSLAGGNTTLGATGATEHPTSYIGGAVDVTLAGTSAIATSGAGAHGLVAQSIGGGGGIANPDSSGGLTQSIASSSTLPNGGAASGYGANVTISQSGTVSTTGAGAFGILAQSIGGGGGLSRNFAGSTGGSNSSGHQSSGSNNGNLSIIVRGAVAASGTGSSGVFAQNRTAGNYGRGNIAVTVNGSVTGGGGTGHGVWFDGGATNTLSVGAGGEISSASFSAVQYTGSGNMSVTNNGIVRGSVSLTDTSTDTGVFTNSSTGQFYAQGDINAIVKDSGTLFIGVSSASGATATFQAEYAQETSSTVLAFDVFSTADYDQMLFSGSGYGHFSGLLSIDFAPTYQPRIGDTFMLIGPSSSTVYFNDWFGSSGDPGAVTVNGLAPGVTWMIGSGSDRILGLTIASVPEPSTVVLTLAGGLGLAWWIRRRCARAACQP